MANPRPPAHGIYWKSALTITFCIIEIKILFFSKKKYNKGGVRGTLIV